MTDYVVELVDSNLGGLTGKRIAVLGVAYKGDVDDVRNSPGLAIARQLQDTVAEASASVSPDGGDPPVTVRLNDPHVEDQTLDLQSLDEATQGVDAVVITTDHDAYTEIDAERLAARMAGDLVVDTKAIVDRHAWKQAGLDVIQI
jgi:UDP-N-acetyl-D-mannosaminuronic acid dehydrogenase